MPHGVKRLWAPWRMAWIGSSSRPTGCVFCSARDGKDDRAALVVDRGPHAFLILNAYPYAPGHLMAVLNRHVATLDAATAAELADVMAMVQRGVAALTSEYRAEGFNVGLNQGRVAGAGIEDHLHVHVVPRWGGDHNFITTLGDTRVLPEDLDTTWQRLRSRVA